ncbi:type I phosphomannose isomerase catalytic subunit, partial [Singulisphaera rosea]
EIQQMSDATFRVHDWGRVGPDGKPRQLHLSEALESIDFSAGPVEPLKVTPTPCEGGTRETLARSTYFALERLRLNGTARVGDPQRFTIVLGLEGISNVVYQGTSTTLRYGESLLLPASIGPCEIKPEGVSSEILTCLVP